MEEPPSPNEFVEKRIEDPVQRHRIGRRRHHGMLVLYVVYLLFGLSIRTSYSRGNLHPDHPLLEVISDYRGNTFRAVYTVRLAGRVYVLHAFQKKSKSGIATPQSEIDLIKQRIKRAIEMHEAWKKQQHG